MGEQGAVYTVSRGRLCFCEKMSKGASKARATPPHRMVDGPLPQPGVGDATSHSRMKKRSTELVALKQGSCLRLCADKVLYDKSAVQWLRGRDDALLVLAG